MTVGKDYVVVVGKDYVCLQAKMFSSLLPGINGRCVSIELRKSW